MIHWVNQHNSNDFSIRVLYLDICCVLPIQQFGMEIHVKLFHSGNNFCFKIIGAEKRIARMNN